MKLLITRSLLLNSIIAQGAQGAQIVIDKTSFCMLHDVRPAACEAEFDTFSARKADAYDSAGNKGTTLIRYANGDVYGGEIKDSSAHGGGTYEVPNKKSYEGDWEDGRIHGSGTLSSLDGRGGGECVYTGSWKYGKMDGSGMLKCLGVSYSGGWKDGKPHGNGTRKKSSDGSSYKGGWKDGKYHGKGKVTAGDGNAHYEGEFENGEKHGPGTFRYADGLTEMNWEEKWEHGVRVFE